MMMQQSTHRDLVWAGFCRLVLRQVAARWMQAESHAFVAAGVCGQAHTGGKRGSHTPSQVTATLAADQVPTQALAA